MAASQCTERLYCNLLNHFSIIGMSLVPPLYMILCKGILMAMVVYLYIYIYTQKWNSQKKILLRSGITGSLLKPLTKRKQNFTNVGSVDSHESNGKDFLMDESDTVTPGPMQVVSFLLKVFRQGYQTGDQQWEQNYSLTDHFCSIGNYFQLS